MNIMHLEKQRNDVIESAEDCRRKRIGRQLFRNLAPQKRLTNPNFECGPFRLWYDDLRPGNVLVNADFKIVSVIGWEYTYSTPAEFTYSPPWWLLLETLEYWFKGLDGWTKTYEPCLETFLRVLAEREEAAIRQGTLTQDKTLSKRMRES